MKKIFAVVVLVGLCGPAEASWLGRLLGLAEKKLDLTVTNSTSYADGDGVLLTNGVVKKGRVFAEFSIGGVKHQTWDESTEILVPKPMPVPVTPPVPEPVTNAPPVVTNTPPPVPVPVTNAPPVVDDFAGVKKWNGADSSAWPVTVHIDSVKVIGGNIAWQGGFERVGKWNEVNNGKCVNGETCLIFNGVAGHFDYLGCEQTVKTLSNVPGYFGRMPTSGERVGFFLETINRDKGNAKMRERSNVEWVVWP